MRTRFLNIDYFTASSSPVDALSFLNLPLPHLPPPPPFNYVEELLRYAPVADIPLEIERLPIDVALGKFISEVIPQDLELVFRKDRHSKQSVYVSEGDEIRFPEDRETAEDDKHEHKSDFIYFEEPDPSVFSESPSFYEEVEKMQVLSEVPEIESNLGLLEPELQLHCSNNVEESIYSVEHISLPYDLDQSTAGLEVGGSVHEQMHFHRETLPLLEVGEICLRNFTDTSMEDQIIFFLEKTESQCTNNNLVVAETEMLDSMQCDMIECLSHHLISKQCLEFQFESLDTLLVLDIVSSAETSPSIDDTTGCVLPTKPVIFEEFKFHDVNASHFFEVFFDKQTGYEPRQCTWLFSGEMNFKNFNELIVTCELALMDDTFRSLPIPFLLDDNKTRSLNIIVEETLSELKQQSLTASDEIYLDWHLLEKDKYNCEIFYSQTMSRELHLHSIDFDCQPLDVGKLIVDFIFSNDILDEPIMEEEKELLNVLDEAISGVPLRVAAASKKLDDKFPKLGNGRHLTEENAAGRASLLHKSMSKFNDLDFFLNPGKINAGVKSECVVMAPDSNDKVLKEGDSDSIQSWKEKMGDCIVEEVLNFPPIQDSCTLMSSADGDITETRAVPDLPYAIQKNVEQVQEGMESFPETIIIVNTQNFDTEMIVSRRSTYQKILALEKTGAQVVERDLDLPVDVLVSSSICLVWYNCRNIGKKATAQRGASVLPLCIENIATNILTLLSFSFSGCILVFEGEVNFLSTVLESSDGLYAAAASLGIDFQLFCSYSCDLTDEIILNSILSANKLCRGIYPKMLESETLAESFLTKFPSINPLVAHAILSSGDALTGFIRRTYEQRVLAIQQYQVPAESIALFSTLCRFGEREDSKSITTDCSSSVSSGPDSEKSHFHVDRERKRQKCTYIPKRVDVQVNSIWQSEHLNQFTDDVQDAPGVLKQQDQWISTDSEMLNELNLPSSSLKDLVLQNHEVDDAWMIDSSNVSKPCHSWNPKVPLTSDESRDTMLSISNLFGQHLGSDINCMNKLDRSYSSKLKNVGEDFAGEVIDLTGNPLIEKNASVIANNMCSSPWLPEKPEDCTRKSKISRRLSFGNLCDLPAADEINSDFDLRKSVKDYKQSLSEDKYFCAIDVNFNKESTNHKIFLEEGLAQRFGGISKELPFKKEMSYYRGTPLSKAIHSTHPQPGSPWTIEFLNRIREKSRLRQQSIPCDTPSPTSRYSDSTARANKRQSPSIIEFFKYQGRSNTEKPNNHKKQKQSKLFPNSSKNKKDSASCPPTWTPIDKRSSQTLSFAMNGSGSQTRLVWSDGSAHRPSKRFRNL